jgi:thiol-disulfide isomerase/thioredoxin
LLVLLQQYNPITQHTKGDSQFLEDQQRRKNKFSQEFGRIYLYPIYFMKYIKFITLLVLLSNKTHGANVLFECEIVNNSQRLMRVWQNDNGGMKMFFLNEKIQGRKSINLEFNIEKPTVIYFNDYPLFVHPKDTVKIFYQRLYSTGYDSLTVKGKNTPYYIFFYQLIKSRIILEYNAESYNDSLWMKYKNELINNRKSEEQFLKKYVAKYKLAMDFYKFAFDEIKYQYFYNCFVPNYSWGLAKKGPPGIPASFYKDLNAKQFNGATVSSAIISALRLYTKYLADSQSNHQLSRYSSEYLNTLYDVANRTFQGRLKKILLMDILKEYQLMNSQSYLSAYKTISEKFRKQYTDSRSLKLVDSLYNTYAVLNKSFPEKVGNTSLIDMQGNILTFKEIISRNKGKIIYADFWATWCVPCVKEMPNSVLMQKKYEGKDVVFIFLSLDSKGSMPLWKKTSIQLNIQNDQYLVEGDFDAELSKYINVDAIPVYFIVDKKGNLVSNPAPRPNTDKLKAIIDKLLVD